MKTFASRRGWSSLLVLFWLPFLVTACGPRSGEYPYSELDTPEQHVYNGFAFLKKERLTDAQREFEQALALDPACSPAYRGVGLVHGMKGDFRRAFDAVGNARSMGKNHLDQALAEVGMMSLFRMEKSEGWLERVNARFARAVSLVPQLPEAYLELGAAYRDAFRFRDAEEAFKEVVRINTRLVHDAGEEINLLKKIERAAPRSSLGKVLVIERRIDRGDTAALLVRETQILEQLSHKTGQGSEPGESLRAQPVPPDVVGHPMKEEIMAALRFNIRGLGTLYDGSFGTDQPMTRAGFARVTADLLMRGMEKPDLYQKYEGMDSPFLDVRANSSYFASIMICSEWAGVMGGWGGYFHPMETISGVDALLVLREAEKKLKGR